LCYRGAFLIIVLIITIEGYLIDKILPKVYITSGRLGTTGLVDRQSTGDFSEVLKMCRADFIQMNSFAFHDDAAERLQQQTKQHFATTYTKGDTNLRIEIWAKTTALFRCTCPVRTSRFFQLNSRHT